MFLFRIQNLSDFLSDLDDTFNGIFDLFLSIFSSISSFSDVVEFFSRNNILLCRSGRQHLCACALPRIYVAIYCRYWQ